MTETRDINSDIVHEEPTAPKIKGAFENNVNRRHVPSIDISNNSSGWVALFSKWYHPSAVAH